MNLLSGHYERPEMLRLADAVTGRRILDAGCGSGPLSEALRDRGAVVSGFDLSGAMIELARARCGEGADLIVHDLADPLPYADGCRASGRTVVYTTWHRPLQPMGDEFTAAGFRISVISEPDPAGRTRPTAR